MSDLEEFDALVTQLDICFVIDTTASMGPYLAEAKLHAREEVEKVAHREGLDLRLALVEYRDHPPQELSFVFRAHPFRAMGEFDRHLSSLFPAGGGDAPEAVFDGLVAAGNLDWREQADHLVFLIGDAPPHGAGDGVDQWPDGCPCKLTAGGIIELYGSKHIRLNAYSIAKYALTTKAFREIAEGCHGTCTEAEHASAVTGFTAESTGETASLMHASSTYAHAHTSASASLGRISTDEEDAAALGWAPEMVSGTRGYLEKRGLKAKLDEKYTHEDGTTTSI